MKTDGKGKTAVRTLCPERYSSTVPKVAYQFLSRLEGIFQQSLRCGERRNPSEVQVHEVQVAYEKKALVCCCGLDLGHSQNHHYYQRNQGLWYTAIRGSLVAAAYYHSCPDSFLSDVPSDCRQILQQDCRTS